jgi:hypothetical protein
MQFTEMLNENLDSSTLHFPETMASSKTLLAIRQSV